MVTTPLAPAGQLVAKLGSLFEFERVPLAIPVALAGSFSFMQVDESKELAPLSGREIFLEGVRVYSAPYETAEAVRMIELSITPHCFGPINDQVTRIVRVRLFDLAALGVGDLANLPVSVVN